MSTMPRFYFPLVGEDGNAVAILARFRRAALKAGWTGAEVKVLQLRAMAGTYDQLLVLVMGHTTQDGGDDESTLPG